MKVATGKYIVDGVDGKQITAVYAWYARATAEQGEWNDFVAGKLEY